MQPEVNPKSIYTYEIEIRLIKYLSSQDQYCNSVSQYCLSTNHSAQNRTSMQTTRRDPRHDEVGRPSTIHVRLCTTCRKTALVPST